MGSFLNDTKYQYKRSTDQYLTIFRSIFLHLPISTFQNKQPILDFSLYSYAMGRCLLVII